MELFCFGSEYTVWWSIVRLASHENEVCLIRLVVATMLPGQRLGRCLLYLYQTVEYGL